MNDGGGRSLGIGLQAMMTSIYRRTTHGQAALLALAMFAIFPSLFAQTPITNGYRDFNYGSTVFEAPTADKPQSKLWWNDGIWWGVLWNPSVNKYRIYRFNLAAQSWIDVGPDIDNRSQSLADALWDGEKLYIASHVYSGGSQTNGNASAANSARLYRYSYNAVMDTYSLDAGFPVLVNSAICEALVIDKDSNGRLWATWTQSSKVYLNRSLNNDLTWGTPFALPTQGSNLSSDDISTLIPYNGKIGVVWSNQNDAKVYFSFHDDNKADTQWEPREVALSDPSLGSSLVDDHLNIKMTSDGNGNLYVASKTSLSGSNAPGIYLLKRSFAGGWTSHVVATQAEDYTRPIVVIDDENRELYVIGKNGSNIYKKKVSLDNINFPAGDGDPFIRSSNADINDPTVSKHSVNGTTGLLVLASDEENRYYYHNYIALPASAPPAITITSFTPASGPIGTLVTISGANFSGVTSVKFNGMAADFSINSSTQITATVPDGATTGKISVTKSGGAGISVDDFVITTGGSSNLLTFHPTDDAHVKSSNATSNYGSATELRVEMNSASDVSTTYLKFNVAGMGGPVQSAKLRLRCTDFSNQGGSIFSVSNNYLGTNSLWVETGLIWNNAPVITGSALSSLTSVDAGQTVELDVTPSILGNGIYSFAIKNNSPNAVLYSSKEGANPPELIIEAPTTSPGDTPTIASFTPAGGIVATEVTITGNKFDGTTAVAFNGTPASFTVDSDAQIRAVVPIGATNGRISVTNSAGTSVSANDFIIQYGLSLNTVGSGNVSLNPSGGAYDAGTIVTLIPQSGTGFLFSGWSGDLSGSTNPVTITIDGNKNVTATFAVNSIVHQESQTGGASGSTNVMTSSNLTGVNGHLYLAAISTRPKRLVVSVTGLGLNWTLVKSICSGNNNSTLMEVWMAQGMPSGDGAVTATLASAPNSAVIAVSRYSGVAAANPVGNVIGGNTNGLNGACSGGPDGNAYSFNLTTTANGAVVYGAAALKARKHTPGAGYTERVEFEHPHAVNPIGVAIEDKSVASSSSVTVNGSFNGLVDWAVVALEIRPATPPSGSFIVHEESQTGGSSGSTTVTTLSSLAGVNGHLYLAAISTRPKKLVVSVTGLGLNWTLVKSICSGNNNSTLMEVWMAQGMPSGDGAVTATFASAPNSAVIAVSRYSGVAAANPVGNVIGGNTNGLNGACSGGPDGNAYSFNLTTTANDAVVYGAVALKARTHTPGAGYTERVEFQHPHAVNPIGVAIEDKGVASPSNVTVNGSFNGLVDWAVVALEIRPATPPSGSFIVHEESQTGGSSGSTTVTTLSSLAGVNDHLYLAAISTRPKRLVLSVTGLGLNWTLVKSICSGNNNSTLMEVWMAQGIPQGGSDGAVTATFASAPNSAVIAVSRYSGVAAANPIGNVIGGNSNGLNGACSGGPDGNAYSFNLATTANDAVVYGAVALKARTHTPGAGYTERVEFQHPHASNPIGVAIEDKSVASAATVAIEGSFNGLVDWAMVALEIKPQGEIPKSFAAAENQPTASLFPAGYELEQNYPNPFNPSTRIRYSLPQAGHVRLTIYDLHGQTVSIPVDDFQGAGAYTLDWQAVDRRGYSLPSGVYFYRLEAGSHVVARSMTLLR